MPGIGVGPGDGAPAVGHGVVDQDVQAPVTLRRCLDGGDEGLLVADVGDHAFGVAALVADRGDHRFQRLGTTTADDHDGAFLGEAVGGGLADPRATAGDEGDLVLQTCCHRSPLLR
ncbi:hypothetical protein D3C84_666400 [compost metagenome]